MKNRSFYFAMLLLLCLCGKAQAQDTIMLRPAGLVTDSAADFTIDNLGNIYLFTAAGQIKKLGSKLDSVAVFNNVRRYGKLAYIDASNPLKLLLFYKEFNTILVLDRFLNMRSSIDLRQSGIFQCSAVAQSYDNNFWVFDELESKIKKIDDNGKVLLESPDFRVVFDSPPRPTNLEDYNRYVYAYDSSKGLLTLDYFGAYKNLLAFKGWQNVHGISNGIAATDKTGLVYFTPGTINTTHYVLPSAILASVKLRIMGTMLYALQKDGRLHIYQLQ